MFAGTREAGGDCWLKLFQPSSCLGVVEHRTIAVLFSVVLFSGGTIRTRKASATFTVRGMC